MKLSVLLTPLVAVTAAGWLGAEGYYLATGNCPLSACTSQEGAVAAQPVTVGTPAATGGDACCPMTPTTPIAAIPIAVAPATAPSDGACCPSLAGTSATTAEGAVAPSAPTAATATGAVAPKAPTAASDGCCPTTPAAAIPATVAPTAKAEGTCASAPADACMPGDACGPNEVAKKDCAPGEACETTKAAKATGLETPSAAMECEPLDCDDEGACCSGADIAPVDTQAPVAPRE